MRTTTPLLLVAPILVLSAACGSDGDSSSNDESVTTESTADSTVGAASTEAPDDDAAVTATDAPAVESPDVSGGGTATVTLANGESFEFDGVLCSLEPQMSAGSEILFTAVSYNDPSLDVTQFGDEGTVTDVASISIYDASYETLWEANTLFGSSVELGLDGSTISGTGQFLQGGDLTSAPVDGEVTASC